MDERRLIDRIREQSRPLVPIAAGVTPKLKQLQEIRAVLFDVYGTLLISASGDVGTTESMDRGSALQAAAAHFQLDRRWSIAEATQTFETTILRHHRQLKERGIEYPEVDIVQVWRETFERLPGEQSMGERDWFDFALEYELQVNPVWPMPESLSTIHRLADAKTILGIVSNAQFFTPLLFPALFNNAPEQLGFDRSLLYFSFAHRQAKPGEFLYRQACQNLLDRGVPPGQVLYIGNDMLNDIAPALRTGFRTALFAGDRRSLRWRNDDQRVAGIEADLIITELSQILECLT